QGDDVVFGGAGDDDLIGGHTVAGGYDGSDVLDGGLGDDVLVGDNAIVLRTGSPLSPRVRVLAGPTLHDGVTDAFQPYPGASGQRVVTLLDHSFAVQAADLARPRDQRRFGDD